MKAIQTKKILLTFRQTNLKTIDTIVQQGGAKSRSDFIEKLVIGFISDLTNHRHTTTALGGYVTFIHSLFARSEETPSLDHHDLFMKALTNLQKRFSNGVPVSKLFPPLKKAGISNNETRQIIESLRYQGIIYEPQPDTYLRTR